MRKILYVVPSMTKNNGIITFLYNYLSSKNLNKAFDYSLLSSEKKDDDVVEAFKRLGVRVYFYKQKLMPTSNYIYNLKSFYLNNEFDIVHINIASTAYFHINLIKKYNKKAKIIMHSHATKFSSSKIKAIVGSILYNLCKNKIDFRFACSNAAGKFLFKSKPFTLIYNALSVNNICIGENLREKYGINDNQILVGLIGRVTKQKNPFFIFKLAQQLKNHMFIVVGDGDKLESMERYISDNQIKNVILTGAVVNAVQLFYNFDFIVMPSFFEGLPLVALEAQREHVFTLASTKVTDEVKISNYIKFIDLNDINLWIESLRYKSSNEFKFTQEYENYDIEYQSLRLKEIYLNILGDYNEY